MNWELANQKSSRGWCPATKGDSSWKVQMSGRSRQFRTSFGPSDNALWLMFLEVLPCETRALATPETIHMEARRGASCESQELPKRLSA